VNSLALNTDYILKMGAFDHTGKEYPDKSQAQQAALDRYKDVLKVSEGSERLISGSDDFTMFLWDGAKSKKPILRLTGHVQLINVVSFSPDGRLIASASFDKSIKLWNGVTGKYVLRVLSH